MNGIVIKLKEIRKLCDFQALEDDVVEENKEVT